MAKQRFANRYDNLKFASPTVYVAGNKIESIVFFEINQSFCEHHSFTLVLNHEVLQKSFMEKPLEVFDLVGQSVSISVQQGENGRSVPFSGLIRKARLKAERGRHGNVIIEGGSPTLLLEQEPRMDVYAGASLDMIIERLDDGVSDQCLGIVGSTQYKSRIEFMMQYKETDWQFMQRLAVQFGENMYYDGLKLVFGEYSDSNEVETLEYDSEISEFDFSSCLEANNFRLYHYLPSADTHLYEEAPGEVWDSNEFIDKAFKKGRSISDLCPPIQPTDWRVGGQADLIEMTTRKLNRTAAGMIYFNGITDSAKIALGRVVRIVQNKNISQSSDLGNYRVVSCKRSYADGKYKCEFSAIPAKLPVVPVPNIAMPMAGSVIGKVLKNNDPMGLGRVEVWFPFATNRYTFWLRVQTPYGGSSESVAKGRGFTFIPEEGDQVVVSFEENNPNKPYVSGCLFHGNNATGGGAKNHLKSIVTSSGHTFEFDDDENGTWGMTIKDRNGNRIHIDTKGKNIEITALETMTLSAKNMMLNVDENMETNIGKNLSTTVGGKLDIGVGESLSASADELKVAIEKNSDISVGDKLTVTSDKTDMFANGGDFVVKSAGKALLQGDKDARISKG